MNVKTKLIIEIYGKSDAENISFTHLTTFIKYVTMPFFLRAGDELGVDDSWEENTWLVNHPTFTVKGSHYDLLTNTAIVFMEEFEHEFLKSEQDLKEFSIWMKDARGWEFEHNQSPF